MGTNGQSSRARRVLLKSFLKSTVGISSFCLKTSNKETDRILLSVGEHLDSCGQCDDERRGGVAVQDHSWALAAGTGRGNTAEMFLCSGQLVKPHLPQFAEFFPPSTGRP